MRILARFSWLLRNSKYNNSIQHRAMCNTIMSLCELAIRRAVRSGNVAVRRQLDVTVEMV